MRGAKMVRSCAVRVRNLWNLHRNSLWHGICTLHARFTSLRATGPRVQRVFMALITRKVVLSSKTAAGRHRLQASKTVREITCAPLEKLLKHSA
jgi:hypothetical protein